MKNLDFKKLLVLLLIIAAAVAVVFLIFKVVSKDSLNDEEKKKIENQVVDKMMNVINITTKNILFWVSNILIGIGIVIVLIVSLLVIFFVWSGFTKNPNVEIINYSLNEDGSQLSFTIGIPNSIGYTRGYKNKGGGVKSHYLNFYNTFGVINSDWGAKFEFTLELDEDDTEVYFNRTGGGYELVLQKNEETGEWERPKKGNN